MNVLSQLKATINNWWLFLIQGIILILGSFYVFASPAESYLTLAFFFAILMLMDGFTSIAMSLSNRENMEGWGWQLAGGILSVILGFILLTRPGITMTILPIIVSFFIVSKGVLIIGTSFDLKKEGLQGWGWILFGGIINLILGLLILMNPDVGVALILIYTGIAFFVMGVGSVVISLRLRKVKRKIAKIKDVASDKLSEIKADLEEYINQQPDDVKGALKELKAKLDQAT